MDADCFSGPQRSFNLAEELQQTSYNKLLAFFIKRTHTFNPRCSAAVGRIQAWSTGFLGLAPFYKGVPVVRAVMLNLLAAGTAAVGALVVLLLGTRLMGVTTVLLPFTTANFLYIASVSLMPELQQERGLRQSLMQTMLFLTGSLLMFASFGGSEPR